MSTVLTPDRFAIRDAGAATFFSLGEKARAIVTLTTLKTSGVESSGETVYSRGGFGNAKLVGFSSNREARINLEDAIFDAQAIAMITGNDMDTAKKIVDLNEVLATKTKKVTLSKTPKASGTAAAIISVYAVKANGANGVEYTLGSVTPGETEYTVNGKELTFYADIPDNVKFRIYYTAETDENAKTMKVTSDAFGGTFRVVLDVLVRDEYTKKDFAGQLRVPNAKFEDNFDFSFSADGDPAVLTLPLEILKDPTSTDMWELVIYDYDKVS